MIEKEKAVVFIDKYNRPKACKMCKSTRLAYQGIGEYKCELCGFLDYDDYGTVRNYIETHRNATVSEISFRTGISQNTITEMLRDERFEITADSKVFLKCKGCGKDIRSGMYCPVCEKIAEAALARKKAEEYKEEHKKEVSGVGIVSHEASSGAKRFNRD